MTDEAEKDISRIVHAQAATVVLGDMEWSLMTNMFAIGEDPTEYPGIAFYPRDKDEDALGLTDDEKKAKTQKRTDAQVVVIFKHVEAVATFDRMAASVRSIFEDIAKEEPTE